MAIFDSWLTGDTLAWLVLVVLLFEALLLGGNNDLARRLSGHGGRRGALLNLGAGAGLTLALLASLQGSSWPWIAAPLSLAGVLHLADLNGRRP